MLGYEAIVYLDVSGTYKPFLATSGGISPVSRNRLDSAAAYGGTLNGTVGGTGIDYSTIAIGAPRNYDFSSYDGSLSFDMTTDLFDDVIKPWIFNRQSSRKVKIIPRSGSTHEYEVSYWNSISITTSEGAPTSVSIGFTGLEGAALYSDNYITNKIGVSDIWTELISSGSIPALNPQSSLNLAPIPYWKTRVSIDGSYEKFATWTLTFSQPVQKFFVCEGNSTVQPPKWLAVGPMTIDFSGDMLLVNESKTISDTVNELIVYIGNSQITMGDLELQTITDDVQGGSSTTPVSLTYSAYLLRKDWV